MAPRPETTQAGAPASSSQSTSTALPGMKRGIAIGVAVSVATILIALLAYCAVQRRKKAKSKARALSQYSDTEAWPKDQKWPIESPMVEADVATIHELEAAPVPELASNAPAQELEAEKSPISELDSTKPASITSSNTEKLLEWRAWNRALEGPSSTTDQASDQASNQASNQHQQHHPAQRTPPRTPPTLSISPPDNSESTLGLSPLGTSPMGVSPIAVSPLEEVYFPNRRFSLASPIR